MYCRQCGQTFQGTARHGYKYCLNCSTVCSGKKCNQVVSLPQTRCIRHLVCNNQMCQRWGAKLTGSTNQGYQYCSTCHHECKSCCQVIPRSDTYCERHFLNECESKLSRLNLSQSQCKHELETSTRGLLYCSYVNCDQRSWECHACHLVQPFNSDFKCQRNCQTEEGQNTICTDAWE